MTESESRSSSVATGSLDLSANVIGDKARAAISSLWLIAIVAFALRLIALDRKSLWLDETATIYYAAQSLRTIIVVQPDGHPPLYYLLVHYWMALGQSEFILRVPSALAGAAAIPLLHGLVRVWGGRWSAVASAWLLAIAPLHIWYSQEARMYALVVMLGLASTWFYSAGIRRAGGWAWVAWIATTAAGLYTNVAMLLLVIAQVALFGPLWRISGSESRTLLSAFPALLVVSLLFLPQGQTEVRQLVVGGGQRGYYIYTILQLLLARFGVVVSTLQLHVATLTAGAAALVMVCIAAWILSGRLNQVRLGTGLVLAAIAVYLLILFASAILRGLLIKRLALILVPYTLAAIAAIVSTHRRRSRLIAGLVFVTLPFTGYTLFAQEQEAWRDVARLIERQAGPQDVIAMHAAYVQWPFDYYYRGEVIRQGIDPAGEPKTLSDMTALHERTWLVLSNDAYVDPQSRVLTWFDSHMRLVQAWSYPGIRVQLYERGAP